MNTMKKVLTASAILATTTMSQGAFAGDSINIPGEFDSYVTVTSEYSFRGVTQTDENPAIQGGIDWSHDSGVYLGVWGSSVDFNDNDEANVELDFFGGYTFNVIEELEADIGVVYYAYPGADSNLDYDFFEVYGSLTYDFDVASLTTSIAHSPEYFGDSGDAQYVTLGAEVPLKHDFSVAAHVGRQFVEDNNTFGLPDYTDWSLSLMWQYKDLALSVSYVDTDLNSNECADGCDSRVLFAVSASF